MHCEHTTAPSWHAVHLPALLHINALASFPAPATGRICRQLDRTPQQQWKLPTANTSFTRPAPRPIYMLYGQPAQLQPQYDATSSTVQAQSSLPLAAQAVAATSPLLWLAVLPAAKSKLKQSNTSALRWQHNLRGRSKKGGERADRDTQRTTGTKRGTHPHTPYSRHLGRSMGSTSTVLHVQSAAATAGTACNLLRTDLHAIVQASTAAQFLQALRCCCKRTAALAVAGLLLHFKLRLHKVLVAKEALHVHKAQRRQAAHHQISA